MTRGLMPGVIHKIIPAGSNDPEIIPDGVVGHIAVSWSDSLHGFFEHESGGVESHFYIRTNGVIEQYRSIFREADAQSAGNSYYRNGKRYGLISVETEGIGSGAWTIAQINSFLKIIQWVHSVSPFPLRKATSWNSGGLGYHRLFEQWNPNNHSCPGDQRVAQFNREVLPRAISIKGVKPMSRRMEPSAYYLGATGEHVTWLGRRLVAHGFNKHGDENGYQPGPVFTAYDRANVRDFQKAQGWSGSDADGFPGNETLKRLAAAPAKKKVTKRKPVSRETRIRRAINILKSLLRK